LSYAGPPTASDAVWAMLVEKRALDFTDLRGRPHRIKHSGYPSLEGKGGKARGFSQGSRSTTSTAPWKRYVTRIESLSIDHTILLDKRFVDPAYAQDVAYTFAFEGANLATLVGCHVSQSVDIAVFPAWFDGLLALGRRERLLTPLTTLAAPMSCRACGSYHWRTWITGLLNKRRKRFTILSFCRSSGTLRAMWVRCTLLAWTMPTTRYTRFFRRGLA
ncbi:MAG: hypothetical protein GYB68_18675, partial [Chloroflexi bacterium]|nr:hypothetical protein [Chloroflexota bacterium]